MGKSCLVSEVSPDFVRGSTRQIMKKWTSCGSLEGQISCHSPNRADFLVSLPYNNSLT